MCESILIILQKLVNYMSVCLLATSLKLRRLKEEKNPPKKTNIKIIKRTNRYN